MDTDKKYMKCRYYTPGSILDGYDAHYCSPNAKTLGEMWSNKHEINVEDCESCENYKCKYIEYPLTIDAIETKQPEAWGISFEPVRVRVCGDNKTYYGILLGEFPWQTFVSFSEEEKKLKISTACNPCIIIPKLKKIVFGAESWWSRLEPGEDIADITDDDIDGTWYVRLLKEMGKRGDKE